MGEGNLSSARTFLEKFIFPVLWISGFGLGTVSLWLGVHHRNGALPPPELKFIFLLLSIGGSGFILWTNASLKRVRVNERQLFISNYFREVCIPFSVVSDVRQNCWLRGRPITIYFRDATEFGDRATFIPKWRVPIRFWRADPVVDELKQLAGLKPDGEACSD
jgi:hypothetical protein